MVVGRTEVEVRGTENEIVEKGGRGKKSIGRRGRWAREAFSPDASFWRRRLSREGRLLRGCRADSKRKRGDVL